MCRDSEGSHKLKEVQEIERIIALVDMVNEGREWQWHTVARRGC